MKEQPPGCFFIWAFKTRANLRNRYANASRRVQSTDLIGIALQASQAVAGNTNAAGYFYRAE
jgi:hypothetical protein